MYTLPLFIVIVVALLITSSKNGLGSFVTLGIFGAAVYTVPALIDTQASLGSVGSRVGYVSVPPEVDFVVLVAWLGLLVGLLLSTAAFPRIRHVDTRQVIDPNMRSVAVASAIIGWAGVIYFMYSQGSVLFFLQERIDQNAGPFATLWKWTAMFGLVSALLSRDTKLLYLNGAILVLIFLRGDRTLVAISTAAMLIVASYRNPGWWKRLRVPQIIGLVFAASVVFLGKTVYLNVKSGLTGQGWDVTRGLTYKQQLMSQFEPLATFNHIEFVIRTGIAIPPVDFLWSIFGNLLLVPSFFGVSTNVYNTTVTAAMSGRLGFGVAGNYLAHGYAVGGTVGAALFYFMLPMILRICDGQFRSKTGTVKVFWCCVGAVIAFYVHRNGLDNLLSFVRQLFIIGAATAGVAAVLRQFGLVGTSPSLRVASPFIGQRRQDENFVLSRQSQGGKATSTSGNP
jgi:hypothetical protein